MVDERILRQLGQITPEEQAILDGRTTIDRDLYMQNWENTVNSKKLLSAGKLITIRKHTRFIHFPEHAHDYVELVYVCQGEMTHLIGNDTVNLKQGELLFLSRHSRHAVCKCGSGDIAVNFIVQPAFFSKTLLALSDEPTPLRMFLMDCLFNKTSGPSYLYFQVAEDVPIQNLIENLIFTLLWDTPNRRSVSQMTMSLLFMQLTGYTDRLDVNRSEQRALKLLQYIEGNYAKCSLAEAATALNCDISGLCRLIRRKTGMTFTELVQERRLSQAAFLLRSTDAKIDAVAHGVGYENVSYFHRIFKEKYGVSPRQYRLSKIGQDFSKSRPSR